MSLFVRTFALDDIAIRSGGDGRTVEAYAAVFDTPAEIRDGHGHYMETISRTAFNRQIGLGIGRVGVYYHHGMTLHGTPSDLGAVPIGHPVEIRADGHGLRTVTRYNTSPLADSVLEAIRNGDLRGYSFRGPIYKSTPSRVPKSRPGADLPMVTRTELGLLEYGPTPTPAYEEAGIMAVRSAEDFLAFLDEEERERFKADLIRTLTSTTPPDEVVEPDQEMSTATPEAGPGTEDQPVDDGHSGRLAIARARLRAELIMNGVL